jgi:hypothetical protein
VGKKVPVINTSGSVNGSGSILLWINVLEQAFHKMGLYNPINFKSITLSQIIFSELISVRDILARDAVACCLRPSYWSRIGTFLARKCSAIIFPEHNNIRRLY